MQTDETRTTLVIGASENPERYAYKAITQLQEHGFKVFAFGLKPGFVGNVPIQTKLPKDTDIDTVTLYVGPERQTALIPEIITLKPRRIIFNPGTENADFIKLTQQAGIKTEIACTLVLLATESYFQ
jgi:predicted CoA-binding protein